MTVRHAVHVSVAIMATIALVAALAAPVHGRVSKKTFTLDVTDAVLAGDADARITITLTNTSKRQRLGAANITIPSPFGDVRVLRAPDHTRLSGGSVLKLRDLGLAPSDSVAVVVKVDVQRCTSGTSGPFDVHAKQANNFNGRGNDVVFDGDADDVTVSIEGMCRLAFVAQPGDAERATRITSVDYDPDGPPVAVEVRDAGDTGRATHAMATVGLTARNPAVGPDDGPVDLGGTTSATAVDGLATFSPGPTLSPSAFDYVLVAAADFDDDGAADATTASTPFDIVDDQVACPAGQDCEAAATAERNGQQVVASFGPGAQAVSLVVSLGAADTPDFTCVGVPQEREAAQYLFVGGDGSDRHGTVTLTVPTAVTKTNHWAFVKHKGWAFKKMRRRKVCWAAPYPFATAGGGQSSAQDIKPGSEATLHVGVLPDCARWGTPERPCVSDRRFSRWGRRTIITIQADGRDPWARS